MRRFTPDRFIALLLCGAAVASAPVFAQQAGRARVTATEQPAETPGGQEQRPESETLRRPAADPQLDRVLNDWYQKTHGIEKLQGTHRRFTFESTFQVAKVSDGKFYFEAPDKGRIDLEPTAEKDMKDEDTGTDGVQIKEPESKKLFTFKADQPEQWVCDGKQVMRIDNAAKTYEVTQIPPEHRGQNIIDGPLPFLFGLPPEKAKERYAMTLVPLPSHPNSIYLKVTPLLRLDAANWQSADVLLDGKTFLPAFVRLLDPSGNRVTLFSFNDHKVNAVNLGSWLGLGDPFKPNLIGYKPVQNGAPPAVPLDGGEVKEVAGMPAVIGLSHADAQKTLLARGFDAKLVKFVMDTAPSDPKLRWHVKTQSPAPKAAVQPGQPIVLTLYITQQDIANQKAKQAQAGK